MTTFAIVGASSMLGKELVRQLLDIGQSVIKIGRGDDNDIVFDLASEFNPGSCNGLKADIILHCASAFERDSTIGTKINFQTNTLGCLNVLLLMDTLSCRHCCYAGTVTSYEDFDPMRMNSYGLSKAHGEVILEWGLSKINGVFCSLRLTGLYDTEGLCCNHQPWFGRIIAYTSRGHALRLPPSLGKRNYMHVSDAASILIASAKKELTGYWSVCHNESFDHAEVAALANQVFGSGGNVIIDETKTPFRQVSYPSDYALFNTLPHKPKVTMVEGLNMILASGFSVNFGPMDVQ